MSNKLIGLIGPDRNSQKLAGELARRKRRIIRYDAGQTKNLGNKERLKDCDLVFVVTPTFVTSDNFDCQAVRVAVKLAGRGKIAVIKSSMLPGTTEAIQQENPGIFVVYAPDFSFVGSTADQAANPERNIVGVPIKNQQYYEQARMVISVLPEAPYNMICAAKNAELIKLASNSFYYGKNIFFNLLYDLSTEMGCNWEIVRQSIAADPLIGPSFTEPIDQGRGVGDDCLLQDFQSLINLYNGLVRDTTGKNILGSIRDKNLQLLIDSRKNLDRVAGIYGGLVFEKKIGPTAPKRFKIIVTGGAGFIGSNLADELIRLGHEAVIIDDLSTGKIEYVNPRAKFYQADIRDSAKIEEIFAFESKHAPIDYVFHLAAQMDVRKSVTDPIFDNQVNIIGSFNIFLASTKHQVKKVIFISTGGAMYGNISEPATEERLPNPDSPYATHKLAAEHNLAVIGKVHNLPYIILRLANVYGPRQYKGGEGAVIATFTNNAIIGEPSVIYGDGRQSRDFVYVGDIVKCCLTAAFSEKTGVYNVGFGQDTDLLELVEKLQKIVGHSLSYSHQPARAGEVYKSVLNNDKARNILGWEPRVSLEEGLKKTIDWCRKQLEL